MLGVVPNFPIGFGGRATAAAERQRLVCGRRPRQLRLRILHPGRGASRYFAELRLIPGVSSGRGEYRRYYWAYASRHSGREFHGGWRWPGSVSPGQPFLHAGAWWFPETCLLCRQPCADTPTDGGSETSTSRRLSGEVAASGVSTLCYPKRYQTWTKVGQKWLTGELIDGANFTSKEFWPDISKKVFHTH